MAQDDEALRINAMRRLTTTAELLGKEKFTENVIPYLKGTEKLEIAHHSTTI